MGVIKLWLSGGIMAARGGVCQLMRRLSKATDAQKIMAGHGAYRCQWKTFSSHTPPSEVIQKN